MRKTAPAVSLITREREWEACMVWTENTLCYFCYQDIYFTYHYALNFICYKLVYNLQLPGENSDVGD